MPDILIIKLTGDVGSYTLNSDFDSAFVGFISFRLIHFLQLENWS